MVVGGRGGVFPGAFFGARPPPPLGNLTLFKKGWKMRAAGKVRREGGAVKRNGDRGRVVMGEKSEGWKKTEEKNERTVKTRRV